MTRDNTKLENQPAHPEPIPETAESLGRAVQIICHRCKNDLATIANLLALRATKAPDPTSLARSMEGRIAALSAVYGHRAGLGKSINLNGLCREVWQRAQRPGQIGHEAPCSLPDLKLSLRLASPLALWLYEIISNAMLHGAAGSIQPGISVQGGWWDDHLYITVQDQGTGLPVGFELDRDSGGGLMVAQAVARYDLGGSMELIPTAHGLNVRLLIPEVEIKRLNEMEDGTNAGCGS